MLRHLTLAALLLAAAGIGHAGDDKLKYTVYTDYFVSNKVDLTRTGTHRVFTQYTPFNDVFRPRPPLLGGKKAIVLTDNDFTMGQVAATVIKEGDAITTYTVEKVANKDGVVTLAYKAEKKSGGGTAKFRSPLIVAFPGKGVKAVEFVENGKKVATVKVGK